MSTGEEKKYDPVFTSLQEHVKKSFGPGISYCYPVSPVYIPLPKGIQDLDGIYVHAVIPKCMRNGYWEFTKKGDLNSVWGNMTLRNYNRKFRVKGGDIKEGHTEEYDWHNSDVGDVSTVFCAGVEHFVQLSYDKETGDLVTKVNGEVYNRHDMADGKNAEEFTIYGDFLLPEVVVPFSEFELPFKVNLNGSVRFSDQYKIEFKLLPKAKHMTLDFDGMKFTVDFREQGDKGSKYAYERVVVHSHCNCAFISYNDEILEQVARRLPAAYMTIDGDITLHRIVISKT